MFHNILVPVDGSKTSDHALATAVQLAREGGGRIRLLHVIDQASFLVSFDVSGGSSGQLFGAVRDSARTILADGLATAQAAGVPADQQLVDEMGLRLGDGVARAAAAWGADLIVVGTHGRRGPSRLLLGSGAEQIIRLAPAPVLVLRAPGED